MRGCCDPKKAEPNNYTTRVKRLTTRFKRNQTNDKYNQNEVNDNDINYRSCKVRSKTKEVTQEN